MDIGHSLSNPLNQPVVPRSGVKRGKDTLKSSSYDFDDRIINLRFIHSAKAGEPAKTFTLRSDYEVIFTKTGCYYEVCRQKPCITVSYKQVSNETLISLTVDVTNMFIKDMATMGGEIGYIDKIEIQMGYRSQLPNWASNPNYRTKPVKKFYSLLDDDSKDAQYGMIYADVLTTQRISAPPDMVTRFQCVVGTKDSGLRLVQNDVTLVENLENMVSTKWDRAPNNSLPGAFYQLITRRFVNQRIPHNVKSSYTETDGVVQSVVLYNSDYTVKEELSLQDGGLSQTQADEYGVLVYMSDVLWSKSVEELPMYGMTADQRKEVTPVVQYVSVPIYESIHAQFEAIKKIFPYVRTYQLMDGNYYAYHEDESDKLEEFFGEPFVVKRQRENGIFKLPAVYDITWSGLRTIRCPFFSAVGSMDTVAFQSSYVLNDLPGYYYRPKIGNNCYLVLLVDVKFSTVGKDNMMELSCTDIDGVYAPKTEEGKIIPVNDRNSVSPGETIEASTDKEKVKTYKETRKKRYVKKTLTVVDKYDGTADTIDGSWQMVVDMLKRSAKVNSGLWTVIPSSTAVLDKVKEWNQNKFSSIEVASGESDTFNYLLPVLNVGDTLDVKWPFLPDSYYIDDNKAGN